jgi:hypothetical protein
MIPSVGKNFLVLYANAIIVDTGMIGNFFENAKPFVKLNPILKPVNEPGPILTAKASILLNEK